MILSLTNLLDLLKLLLIMALIGACICTAPFVIAGMLDAVNSDTGLWTECPNSGFTPDSH